MKKYFIVFLLLAEVVICTAQKLYCVVNIKGEFAGISYTKSHVKEEFRSSVPRIVPEWKLDVNYKAKKTVHKFSLEQSSLDKNFRIINKFQTLPGQPGFVRINFGTGIDHLIIGYSLQKDAKKEKGFLFHSRIRFNYSVGFGFSFNRSKKFYERVYASSADGRQSQYTYVGYQAIHFRDGVGFFLKGSGGFDFINKKGNRKLSFSLYYTQGLKDMVHYNIHYQYGYWNDPSRQVDVPKQVLRTKGTVFGFNLGFPITILK